MIKKGETIPFDLGPMRTIFFDLTDLDDVVATRVELARQVAAAMAIGAIVDTPIGQAMDFEKLRSGTDTDRLLLKVIERLDSIEGEVRQAARQERAPSSMSMVRHVIKLWKYHNASPGAFDESAVLRLATMLDIFLKSGVTVQQSHLQELVGKLSGGDEVHLQDVAAVVEPYLDRMKGSEPTQ